MGQRGGFGPSLDDTKLYLFLYALGMTHGVETTKIGRKGRKEEEEKSLWPFGDQYSA